MADEVDIYITVTRGTGSSWKPVKAIQREEGVYEIVGKNPAPGSESWQFSTGDRVRCKPYDLTDNDCVLVAFEKVERGG